LQIQDETKRTSRTVTKRAKFRRQNEPFSEPLSL
jgi:hypothetical protein